MSISLSSGKAKIQDDIIHANIYDQEGNLIPFMVKDTAMNRFFVQWLQRHDRYTKISQ